MAKEKHVHEHIHYEEHMKVRKVGVLFILAWVFGVLSILGGAMSFGESIFGAILILLGGVIILPPFGEFIQKKFNFQLTGWLKFIVFLVLAGVGISLTTTSSGNIESGTAEIIESQSVKEEVLKPKEFKIGEEILAGAFKWKIIKLTKQKEIGEYLLGTFMGEKADGEFLIVDIEVENIGKSAQYLMDSFIKLVDNQNREFSPNTMAAFYLKPEGSALMFEIINPGIKKRGKIVYDVPEGLKIVNLRISDNLMESSFYNVKLMT